MLYNLVVRLGLFNVYSLTIYGEKNYISWDTIYIISKTLQLWVYNLYITRLLDIYGRADMI